MKTLNNRVLSSKEWNEIDLHLRLKILENDVLGLSCTIHYLPRTLVNNTTLLKDLGFKVTYLSTSSNRLIEICWN